MTTPDHGRTVLLARPHQFIIEVMSGVLARNGYQPLHRGPGGEYPPLQDPALKGAIVSTAVQSSVPEDHMTVYSQLRSVRPDLPLLFATLVPAAEYVRALRVALGRRSGDASAVTLAVVSGERWQGRRPGEVLLLDKHDIESGGATLDRALLAWFG